MAWQNFFNNITSLQVQDFPMKKRNWSTTAKNSAKKKYWEPCNYPNHFKKFNEKNPSNKDFLTKIFFTLYS